MHPRRWKARKGSLGILPLALLSTMLTVNMANTWLLQKSMWLILALALAVTTAAARGQARVVLQGQLLAESHEGFNVRPLVPSFRLSSFGNLQ